MERLFKRYFWTIPLVVIVICALLAARGINQILEAKFLLGEGGKKATTAKKVAAKPTPVKPPPSKDADAVVARNMFCSTCDPPKPPEAPAAGSIPEGGRPPNTSLPLALLATMITPDDPDNSTAAIQNTQATNAGLYGLYGLHEQIPGAGEIIAIKPRYVDFINKSTNRPERIEINAPAPPPPPHAPPPPSAPVASAPPQPGNPEAELMAAVDKGVRQVGDTRYDIDRSLVDKILADPTAVARSARIVPSIKDGKANGFKLYAIRPNSPLAKIGLQNGDTITAVNGFEMSSADKALEVYTKMKSASNLSVQVIRRGQPVSMEYSIK